MAAMDYDYDLIVIGSGPAGEKGAAQAAYFKKSVALIEKEPPPIYGGAAANTGTLPSKTLRETALFLSGFRNRELEGLEFRWKEQVDISKLMTRRKVVVGNEQKRIATNLQRHGITTYEGNARFVGPQTLSVATKGKPETLLRAQIFLIATGSTPFRPNAFQSRDPRVVDSDTVLNIKDIPRSLLVVGGGVIGCEYACMFAIMGVDVALVEKRDRILPFLDWEVSDTLKNEMLKLGVRLYMGDSVAAVDHGDRLTVRLETGPMIQPEMILISSGRTGNTASLNLGALGITPDKRGRIPVDATFRTAVPHVYAAGDVVDGPALASTAMEQGRIAMVHAFQLEFQRSLTTVLPYGIYTIPECSMAGPTEQELIDEGASYVAGKATYEANARGQIIGDNDGFLKLLFREEDMKLLGVHVIGEQATELIHIGLTALQVGATAELFIHTCHNYPTLSEMYKYATYDALGRRARKRAGLPI
ncbi:Si-specific NAD(P)(+) transhydrogenase [soil metagenome]